MGRNDERKIGLLRQIKESNNTCRGRGTIADNKRGDYALKLNRTVFLFLVLVVCFFVFVFLNGIVGTLYTILAWGVNTTLFVQLDQSQY